MIQRNNLLKQAATLDEARELLFVWDKQIAEEGAKVVFKRSSFCEKLKTHAKKMPFKFNGRQRRTDFGIRYSDKGESVKELSENYLTLLTDNVEKTFS